MIKNILQALENSERKFPEKIIFGESEKEVTYSEFLKNSKKIGTNIIKNIKKKKNQ